MAIGKCPKCESVISRVETEDVMVQDGFNVWKGLSYLCPSCKHILSVAINPVALQDGNAGFTE